MEVHHHSHTARKKWTHYFWEFLMLFLAVTLGFLVENQREHYIEKQRAKQYAFSLIEDLKADSSELMTSISQTKEYALIADSLLTELDKPIPAQNDTTLQMLTSSLLRYSFYDPQLGTYNQIKNSGSLRYFDIEVVKKLNYYETMVNAILKVVNQSLEFRVQHLQPFVYKIVNMRFLSSINKEINYNGPSFTVRPHNKIVVEWYNYANYVKSTYDLLGFRMENHLKRATELIALLEKTYGKQ